MDVFKRLRLWRINLLKILNLVKDFEDPSLHGGRSEFLFKGKDVLLNVFGSGFEVSKSRVRVCGCGRYLNSKDVFLNSGGLLGIDGQVSIIELRDGNM